MTKRLEHALPVHAKYTHISLQQESGATAPHPTWQCWAERWATPSRAKVGIDFAPRDHPPTGLRNIDLRGRGPIW
eukprot:4532195-Alexandrium_andersonii.AAC.1